VQNYLSKSVSFVARAFFNIYSFFNNLFWLEQVSSTTSSTYFGQLSSVISATLTLFVQLLVQLSKQVSFHFLRQNNPADLMKDSLFQIQGDLMAKTKKRL